MPIGARCCEAGCLQDLLHSFLQSPARPISPGTAVRPVIITPAHRGFIVKVESVCRTVQAVTPVRLARPTSRVAVGRCVVHVVVKVAVKAAMVKVEASAVVVASVRVSSSLARSAVLAWDQGVGFLPTPLCFEKTVPPYPYKEHRQTLLPMPAQLRALSRMFVGEHTKRRYGGGG